jgi:hypothetical protein
MGAIMGTIVLTAIPPHTITIHITIIPMATTIIPMAIGTITMATDTITMAIGTGAAKAVANLGSNPGLNETSTTRAELKTIFGKGGKT